MDLVEIIEEAYRRIGRDPKLLVGGDLESARISVDLVLTQWSVWGLVSWGSAPFTVTVTGASAEMPAGTIDIIPPINRRDGDLDLPLLRMPFWEWAERPTPDDTGTPTHYTVDRRAALILLRFWPAPTVDRPAAVSGWRLRQLGAASDLTVAGDIPSRWAEPLIAELASKLFRKLPPGDRAASVLQDISIDLLEQRKTLFSDNSDMGSWYY